MSSTSPQSAGCGNHPDQENRGLILTAAIVFRVTLFFGTGASLPLDQSSESPLGRLEARFEQIDERLPEPYRSLNPRPTQTATMIVLDVITIGLLTTIVWASGASSSLVLIYAWNPLVVGSVAALGRIELIAMMAVVWAVKELITATSGEHGDEVTVGDSPRLRPCRQYLGCTPHMGPVERAGRRRGGRPWPWGRACGDSRRDSTQPGSSSHGAGNPASGEASGRR